MADMSVDSIRRRFGFYSIQRGIMFYDRALSKLNAKDDNTVHPHGYMERGNRTGADGAKADESGYATEGRR